MRASQGMNLHVLAVAAALVLGAAVPAAAATDPKAAKFYEDALGRFQKKDYAGAVIQLKNSLQVDKDQLAVQLLLGKALLADSDVVGAEVAFNEALRLGVDRAEVVVPLANALLGQGKQQLLFDQPRFIPNGLPRGVQQQLLILRATAFSDLGNPRDAFRALEEARAVDPGVPDTWLAEVPLRIRARQFREAHVAADRAMALDAQSAEALYLKGSILHAQSQVQPAVGWYDKTLKLKPDHAEALIARAGLAIDQGKPADAARDLEALKRVMPTEPRAAFLRALLAERQGQPAAAKAALADIVGLLDPVPMNFLRYRPQVLILGGLAHYGLGNLEKAKPYLEAVQRQQAGNPVAKLLAQIYLNEKGAEKALDVLTTYLRATPQDTQATMLMAAVHMQLGRHARATALMQDALKGKDVPQLRTVLGLSLIGDGKPDAAMAELEATFKKDSNQHHAGVALVGLYLRSGQPRKALAAADSLVKQQPGNASFQNLLGMARGESGDVAGARAAFESAVKLVPSFHTPQINLARMDIAARRFDAAAARLDQILRNDNKNVDAALEFAQLSARKGQDADTTRWLAKAADVSPTQDSRALMLLVEHHLAAGRKEAALETARQLMGRAPEDLAALTRYARVLLANNDLAGARTALTNATRIANFDASAQTEVAMLQMQARDMAGASYSLQKGLSGDPNHLQALALMAEVDIRQGNLAQAEQRAREVLQRHPRSAAGHGLLGNLAMARGQAALAAEAYRQAHQVEPSATTVQHLFTAQLHTDPTAAYALAEQWLKSRPADPTIRTALADAYARARSFGKARQHYEMRVRQRPGDGAALNNLANVLLELNDPGAMKVAEQAVAASPGNAHAIDTLGWALHRNGQNDRALALLRDARLRAPDNLDIRLHLAAVLNATSRKAEASEELQFILRNGRPDSTAVKAARALVSQ
jgi:cellulose synthase operon protein C